MFHCIFFNVVITNIRTIALLSLVPVKRFAITIAKGVPGTAFGTLALVCSMLNCSFFHSV